ncbi:hypothetical protein CK203_114829 [Vitis vinifera]|uniref:Uncharacterized protein n=1 Tax=Vitis vinifera TaxID=29760 RepID=A0A438FEQ3_VITVI|nr:hypothetical protein CK203_114829 [Vitis vinifera]
MFPPADDPPDLGIHPTAALCPSGQTLAFVPAINAMPPQGILGAELTEALYNKIGVIEQEWSFLDGIRSGTSLKSGRKVC